MMSEVFNFGANKLRVFSSIHCSYLCAYDVAKILKLERPILSIRNDVKNNYKIKLSNIYGNKNIIYIKEAGLYPLILKSNSEDASNFYDWIFGELLPSIRDAHVENINGEIKKRDDQLNRLHIMHRELLSLKKNQSMEETIYIVSTTDYARQGIFKIGRTKNSMKLRSSGHNNTHIQGDKVQVFDEFKVNNATLVERNIHVKLNSILLKGEKEFFLCPYHMLKEIVELIVQNDNVEHEAVNKIIDTIYTNTSTKDDIWML